MNATAAAIRPATCKLAVVSETLTAAGFRYRGIEVCEDSAYLMFARTGGEAIAVSANLSMIEVDGYPYETVEAAIAVFA